MAHRIRIHHGRDTMRLKPENTVLTVIDVQGKLAELMHQKDELFKNLKILIQGAQAMEIPILWLEQLPEKLGSTREEIAPLLKNSTNPIAKTPFSAWFSPEYKEALTQYGRNQIILCGIETHICVYQTAADLLTSEFEVTVAADCTSSRTAENKSIGLENIRDHGGRISCTESILFESLATPEHPVFRMISRLVK